MYLERSQKGGENLPERSKGSYSCLPSQKLIKTEGCASGSQTYHYPGRKGPRGGGQEMPHLKPSAWDALQRSVKEGVISDLTKPAESKLRWLAVAL